MWSATRRMAERAAWRALFVIPLDKSPCIEGRAFFSHNRPIWRFYTKPSGSVHQYELAGYVASQKPAARKQLRRRLYMN